MYIHKCIIHIHASEMIPSKSRKSESRRSSILKPRKPRQPLQNVNFDSSSNENSPSTSKVKRRVSFAEKKHVKEFCHSSEQGTVWDNTYEEHDSILKGSFIIDQNTEGESKEIILHASNNDFTHIHSESDLCYLNNTYLVNNQPQQQSAIRVRKENNDTNCNLNFTALPHKSCVSNDWVSSNIVIYNNLDKECMKLPDGENQSEQIVITDTSKSVKSSNIMIYRDSDEENCEDDVTKKYPKLYSNNVDCELDTTHIQDFSMELTAPISVSLVSSHSHIEEQKKQECNKSINNLESNTTNCNNVSMEYTVNCNNVSMEITEAIPVKSVVSNLETFNQIPTILQNCEHTKWNATNTRNTMFPTNLQSDIVSKDISKHISDVKYANDSIALTSVIQPFTDATDTGICHTNNTIFDTSMEMTMAISKIDEKANNEITAKTDLRKDQTDKTEIFNDILMEMKKPIGTISLSNVCNQENIRMNEPISGDDRTTFFHNVSMEMTKTMSTRNEQEITDGIICKSSEENTDSKRGTNISNCFNDKTLILCKSMELTEALPEQIPSCQEKMFHAAHVAQSNGSTCEIEKNDKTKFFDDASMEITKSVNIALLNIDKANLKINESKDDKTILFHNISMEMTTAVSSRKEITQPISKSISKESTHRDKDGNDSTCFNEGTKLLCKSMEFTEVVPVSLHEITFSTTDTTHPTQSVSFSQRLLSKTISLPAENSVRVQCQTDVVANETIQDTSMEIISAVPSILHLAQDVKVNETENLIVSENNEFQHLIINSNLTELKKDVTEENFTISREIVEAENIRHNELSNDFITQSPLNNLARSLDINLENVSKKRMFDDNEKSYSKRARSSFMEIQSSQENDVHLFSSIDANCINDLNDIEQERNEYFVKETIDHSQISCSNPRKSLDEINNDSFSTTVQNINHSISLIIKEIEVTARDQVEDENEKEYIRKKLNEDAKLQINIEEQGQYSDETKKLSDHLEGTEIVIEDQINHDEHRINLNDKMKQQNMRQKNKCTIESFETAHNISTINEDVKNKTLTEDPFITLLQELETHAAGDNSIWNVYYSNNNRKMIVFGFIANSLLIATFLSYDFNNGSEKNLITEIKIISRLSDDAGVLIKIVHKLILEKINAELLASLYKTHQDILPMLNFISQDVKLAMNFKFDLKRLDDLNLMEIANDKISFISRSKRLDIILKVTIKIKRFDKLTPNDINSYCILGRIKERDIKNLIKNVKRDHKFLRRYMNDIKNYIDIMEDYFEII